MTTVDDHLPSKGKGGRPKGSINRASEEAREKAAASGEMPLDYMLRIMRDKKADKTRRDDMAKAAARYLHPTISAIEHSGNVQMTHEMALKQLMS